MTLRLLDRVRRLETAGRPRSMAMADDGREPTLIVIRGGLPEPMRATILPGDGTFEPLPGEPYEAFAERMMNLAAELGAKVVVIGGLLPAHICQAVEDS